MLQATRQWVRRNRTPIAIGAGVIGAGYVATQYVLGKINDARERMSTDRIAKENLRRRFEQNQEDCTFTVLALLPTATQNILEAMNTEKITLEIQQMKGAKGLRSGDSNATPPSIADTTLTEDDSRSNFSGASESIMHASQASIPPPPVAEEVAESAASAAPTAPAAEGEQEATAGDAPTTGANAPVPASVAATVALPVERPISAHSSAPTSAPRSEPAANLAPPGLGPSILKKKSKRQLWDDLTISSITRSFTLMYTLALLTMLTRLQLNLLGRRSYLSSVVSLATGPSHSTISLENNDVDNVDQVYGSDFEVNRKYLTFSWWLLNRGWIDLRERVEEAVKEVFGHLSPRDLLSFDNFCQLTLEVRKKVEGGPNPDGNSRWLRFLLPPTTLEEFVLRESGVLGDSATADTQSAPPTPSASPSSLRRLIDETSDIIESPSFHHVLGLLLDSAFLHLLHHKVLPGAFDMPTTTPIPEFEPQGDSRVVLLPKILSVLTRQAHSIGNGMPNEYLGEMESVRDLEAFAAVVYSSNWENEIGVGDQFGSPAAASEHDITSRQQQQQAAPSQTTGTSSFVMSSSTQIGEESMVFVQPPPTTTTTTTGTGATPVSSSFESAWEKALEPKQ